MPIEFRCPNCDKKLRTGDDKAGKTARCPQCGTPVTVPGPVETAEDDFGGFSSFDDLETDSSALPPRRGRSARAAQVACPMCGAMNDPAAGRCYACGEDLTSHADAVPAASRPGKGQIDLSLALSNGWAIFRDQLGAALAILVVSFAVMIAAFIPLYLLFVGGLVGVMAAGGGPNMQPNPVLFALLQIAFTFLMQLVVWFISIGVTRALLLLVRRKELEIGAIFSGGRYYGLMALNSLVLFAITQGPSLVGQVIQQAGVQGNNGALVGIGAGLSLISLLISAIVYPCVWPYVYIIIDDRAGTLTGLEPLRRAWRLTPGSRLVSFVLFLALWIINIAGVLACCIGVIFTSAYMMVTLTVAYEQLSPRVKEVASRA